MTLCCIQQIFKTLTLALMLVLSQQQEVIKAFRPGVDEMDEDDVSQTPNDPVQLLTSVWSRPCRIPTAMRTSEASEDSHLRNSSV